MKKFAAALVFVILFAMFQNFTVTSDVPAESTTVQVRAYFNRPLGYQQKPAADGPYNLTARLKQFIKKVPAGETIHASIFAAENTEILDELVKASRDRGVIVNIVFDDQQTDNASKRTFFNTLKAQIASPQQGRIYQCTHGGCIGWAGNNHNKFFTFSKTKNEEGLIVSNVSVQTSMNLIEEQEYQYQDMIVVENDAKIYGHYVNYWKALADSTRTAPDYNFMNGTYGQTKSADVNLKVFSSASMEEDPILLDLNKISLDESSNYCRVDMSQSLLKHDLIPSFTYADEMAEDRVQKIIKKLADLKKKGCEVHIVVTDEQKGDPDFVAAIKTIQNSDALFDLVLLKDEPTSNKSHSKLVLISAPFIDADTGSVEIRNIVYAGSMNMVTGSLRQNDDSMIRIRSQKIYDAYLQQFEHLRKYGTKSVKTPLYADYPSAANGNYVFKTGVALEPQIVRLSSGGMAKSCLSNPTTLPQGLVFNKTSCEITGTPTAPYAKKTFSIVADSSYSDYLPGQVQISIEVSGAVKPKIAYAASAYSWSYYSNFEIRPVAQGLSGLTYSISPEIPSGAYYLSFNKKTGVFTSTAIGDTSDSTNNNYVLQPTRFTITARNSSGATASTTLTLSTGGYIYEDNCGGRTGRICP